MGGEGNGNRSRAATATAGRRALVADEILQQATRLFVERGYDATSMQDVARAVGLTRTGLYNYFAGKEDLLSALVTDGSARTARILRAAVERGAADPREQLGDVVRILVEQRTAAPGRFRVLDREASALPAAVAAAHEQAKADILATVRSVVADGIRAGQFKPCEEQVAAHSVIALCNWVAWWFQPDGELSAQSVTDQMVRHAVDMLAARDGAEPLPGPQGALRTIRQNLDYLQRTLPPD